MPIIHTIMGASKRVEQNGEIKDIGIGSDLHRKLKTKCAERGELMRVRVELLIKEWLAKEGVRA